MGRAGRGEAGRGKGVDESTYVLRDTNEIVEENWPRLSVER